MKRLVKLPAERARRSRSTAGRMERNLRARSSASAPVRRLLGAVVTMVLFATLAGAATDLTGFQEVTAQNYQVLAQGGRPIAHDVNAFMNLMLGQYSMFFADWSVKQPARVIVFSTDADFRAYLGDAYGLKHPGIAAVCVPTTDAQGQRQFELVARQNDFLYRDLAHEGFHQFIWYVAGDRVPIWFNEGLAQYCETSYVLHGQLHLGDVSRSKLQIAQAILRQDHAPTITQLITMNKLTFYRNAPITYPLAWALAYYLMQRENRTFHETDVHKYLQDLQYGRDPVKQFWLRFGRDEQELSRDFVHYILNLQARVE